MTKRKKEHFAEMASFPNLFQLNYFDLIDKDFSLKGKWNCDYFKNENPIVIELGCGKGEYTVGLAQKNKSINYIGFDIKGARLWRGCKTALEEGLRNVAFVRTQINLIEKIFATNEVSEIWITFPDPQLRNCKENKRLTSPFFLEKYKKILKSKGTIHLKTDDKTLFEYTEKIIETFQYQIINNVRDLYNSAFAEDEILSIRTFYEQLWLAEKRRIFYLSFII